MQASDAQRKNDIGTIANGIAKYGDDFARFPLSSSDGKILACRPKVSESKKADMTVEFEPCEWGKDALEDALDPSYPNYIDTLPADPHTVQGASYLYLSNGKRFQIYAHLEGVDEAEYDIKIVAKGLTCGNQICNFGRAWGDTPLDKSIEEYENELMEKNQKL